MKKLFPIMLALLLLTSCELMDKPDKGKIYLVSASLDYRSTSVSSLLCPNEDQAAVIDQFAYLAELMDKGFYSYSLTQDGENVYERTLTRPLLGDTINRREYFDIGAFKNRLRKLLDRVALVSNPEDLIIFYYAGHGVKGFESSDADVKHLNGALVLGNVDFPEIGDWRTSDSNSRVLYPISELRSDMGDIPGRKLIILDSCYSGEVVRDELDEGDEISMLSHLIRPRKIYMDNIWELTGSRYDEKSFEEMYDDEVYHGRFTSEMLKELGYRYGDEERPGSPSEGLITVYSLYESIRDHIDDRAQTPDTSSSFVDLVLFRLPGSVRTL